VKRASTMKKKDTTTGTRCNQQVREVMKMRKPPKSNENTENENDRWSENKMSANCKIII
jgi:hypothetical protein